MKLAIFVGVLFLLLVAIAALIKQRAPASRGTIKARALLTKREQPMYFRLTETFPEHIVLAQVAFSALLTAQGRATRNAFDRKVADFVLCSKAFQVIAVIELDDSTHNSKRDQDKARDAMLTSVGYTVLRFANVPDAADLRKAVPLAV